MTRGQETNSVEKIQAQPCLIIITRINDAPYPTERNPVYITCEWKDVWDFKDECWMVTFPKDGNDPKEWPMTHGHPPILNWIDFSALAKKSRLIVVRGWAIREGIKIQEDLEPLSPDTNCSLGEDFSVAILIHTGQGTPISIVRNWASCKPFLDGCSRFLNKPDIKPYLLGAERVDNNTIIRLAEAVVDSVKNPSSASTIGDEINVLLQLRF